jgi:hypothetical protein
MPKVISSEGLNEFIETGKHQTIEPQKATPVKESVTTEPAKIVDPLKVDPVKAEEAKKLAEERDDGLDAEDADLAEKARLKINRKHRELKAETALRIKREAEAAEAERFAEQQFNERRLVETERDRLKSELDTLKSRLPQAQADDAPKAPNKDDPKFKNDKGEFEWDRFTEAQADFKVEQFKREQAKQAQEAQQAQIQAALNTRIEAATKKYPDFVEVVGAASEKDVPPYLLQAMREREMGTDLAYYFAKNRDELTRLSKLSPIAALAELGRIETRFDVATEPTKTAEAVQIEPVKTSSAPPPITPINANGAGTVVTDPSRMDFKQLRAFERERLRKGRT